MACEKEHSGPVLWGVWSMALVSATVWLQFYYASSLKKIFIPFKIGLEGSYTFLAEIISGLVWLRTKMDDAANSRGHRTPTSKE